MSWEINHNITAPFNDEELLINGLTVIHQINPVTQASLAQIQSDWNQSNNTAVDFIKNKPNIDNKVDKITGKGLSTDDYVAATVVESYSQAITTAINNLINGAPGALDTLKELADALADDASFAATITNALSNKIDKVLGKGLSTEDFTTAFKNSMFEVFSLAISDETSNLTAGTAKITVHWPYNFTLQSVFIGVNTAPTELTLIVDVNDNSGNSIFSTRPTILISEFTSLTNGTQPVLVTTSFTKGQKLTVDIDQVGSTISGKGLKLYMIGIKS